MKFKVVFTFLLAFYTLKGHSQTNFQYRLLGHVTGQENNYFRFSLCQTKLSIKESTQGERKALSEFDAKAAMQIAEEINYPGFRVSPRDLNIFNNHWISGPHFHFSGVGKGDHIRISFP